jgi:predicted transcriptional regulator
MLDFLDNFKKRMEWMGIANSIINRKGKNTAIENQFEENELTNIIVSVLLFIMEKTLEENNECEMYHIENFLDELLQFYYSKSFTRQQIKDISGYIIKDILQNNGVRYTYPVINYESKKMEEITIRLIADKIIDENNERKIVYMLTNQGYEFLFRMREIDEEIQLTIEQLKLKEYIKRKKFSSAVRQSVELISYVRQKKKDIENFILSIKQNIYNVDVEQYEALIKSTYAMLTEEYETMEEIQKMIIMAEEKIKEEFQMSRDFEQRLAKARAEIMEIHHNIGIVITEQRDLILNRYNLTDLYIDTIKKSFEFSFEKRYNFEETVLVNLERYSNILDNCLSLLKPLFMPNKRKMLGIGDIYEPQIIYKEAQSQDTHVVSIDEYDDSAEKARIREISNRYVDVMALIFSEAMQEDEISLSRILDNVRDRSRELYHRITEDRCIFLVALKLYDIGRIPVEEFYQSRKRVLLRPSEEFNVEYCLVGIKEIIDRIDTIKELIVEKAESEIEVSLEKIEQIEEIKIIETIRMTDVIFKVVR